MNQDLSSWEVEQLRRSIAMLPAGSKSFFTREEALQVLGQLRHVLALLEHPSRAPDGAPDAHPDTS
jgi:hypothetical protein